MKKTPAAKPAGTDAPAPSIKNRNDLRFKLAAIEAGAKHEADPRAAITALATALLDHLGD